MTLLDYLHITKSAPFRADGIRNCNSFATFDIFSQNLPPSQNLGIFFTKFDIFFTKMDTFTNVNIFFTKFEKKSTAVGYFTSFERSCFRLRSMPDGGTACYFGSSATVWNPSAPRVSDTGCFSQNLATFHKFSQKTIFFHKN